MDCHVLIEKFKQPKLAADIGAGVVAVIGLTACFTDSKLLKDAGLAIFGAGLGVWGINEILATSYVRTATNVLDRLLEQAEAQKEQDKGELKLQLLTAAQTVSTLKARIQAWEEFWTKHNQENTAWQSGVAAERDDLLEQLKRAREEIFNLATEHQQFFESNVALQDQLTTLKQQHSDRQTELAILIVFIVPRLQHLLAQWRDRLLQSIRTTLQKRPERVQQLGNALKSKRLAADSSSPSAASPSLEGATTEGEPLQQPTKPDFVALRLEKLIQEINDTYDRHCKRITVLMDSRRSLSMPTSEDKDGQGIATDDPPKPQISLPMLLEEVVSITHEAGSDFAALKVRYRNVVSLGDRVEYQVICKHLATERLQLLRSNTTLQGQVETLSKDLEQHQESRRSELAGLTLFVLPRLRQVIQHWYDFLLEAIATSIRRRPELAERLEKLQFEVQSAYVRQEQQLTEFFERRDSIKPTDPSESIARSAIDSGADPRVVAPDPASHLPELMEQVVSLLREAATNFAVCKVRYRNTLSVADSLRYQSEIEQLRSLLEQYQTADVIPRSQHEAILTEFKTQKDQTFDQLLQQAEALETDLQTETDQYVQKLIRQLEQAEQEIQQQKARIDELTQPQTFRPATREDMRMGNQIIEYFRLHGVVMDRAGTEYRKYEATLLFHVDRNPRLILASELNEHNEKLQQVLRCLNTPKFEYNSEAGLMSAKLVLSRKPAISTDDASRIWKSKSQFEKLAAQWIRVRVTGGSEAGKSPTAENIAVCLLKARPGKVKLSNPQYHSRKNHWSLPVTWTSHKGSVEGMKELADRVEKRSAGLEGFEEFALYIFDEIDSTFAKHKSASQYVLSSVKQASHQNLGMVFVGQNANASEYPRMDRSDFENCVNVHIGGNAKHAIVNSNMSSDLKSELQNQYDKLLEFCEVKNAELSLDNADPQAYRFALVIEPQKKPYFIELPHFGCYTFDQIQPPVLAGSESVSLAAATSASAVNAANEAANPDSTVAAGLAADDYIGFGCPKCTDGILGRVKTSRGHKYYVCDTCSKSTSENLLRANSNAQVE